VKLTLDGLVIEEVNMTWPSSHEHVNNTLRLPGKMRDTWQATIRLHPLAHR